MALRCSKHAVDGVGRVQLFVIGKMGMTVAEWPRPLANDACLPYQATLACSKSGTLMVCICS